LVKAIKIIFIWSLGIGVFSTVGYIFAGEPLVKFMAKDINVINGAQKFLPWLLIAPFISCIAFTWDGIFIGATASKSLRNSMIWSVVGFFASYYLFENMYGIQALWVAFMMHLLIRTIYLSAMAKREVYGRVR
jgi:Na+-driven multidrug efflux pump